MQHESLSRRGILTLAGACLIPWENLYAREFWDKKDPSQWTGEEIDQLTTKSPWAKSVTAQYAPGDRGDERGGYPGGSRSPNSYPPPWGGGGGGIGIGMPRRGGMGRPGGGYPQNSSYKGTVRWESAQPVLDALKTPLPDAFANLYVVGTRDIPFLDSRQRQSQNSSDNDQDQPKLSTPDSDNDSAATKRTVDRIKSMTTIQVKGKEIVSPKVVQQMTPGGSYFLFGFPKDALDFGKKDHQIDFSTQLGRLIVKAKFDPSEMIYHGNLAV
jgi:hypothetical protein